MKEYDNLNDILREISRSSITDTSIAQDEEYKLNRMLDAIEKRQNQKEIARRAFDGPPLGLSGWITLIAILAVIGVIMRLLGIN